jgi:subtilase family serine protease
LNLINFSPAGALLLAAANLCALTPAASTAPRSQTDRILSRIDEAQVVTLQGNMHPLARAEFEVGAAPAETRLERMMLLLQPSPSQQAALDALVAAQQDSGSPAFHRWLTPAEYAARFGVSPSDLARIGAWLTGHGFTLNEIAASRRLIIFSGTAGQVADAFHAEMRRYRVNGALHLANAQDPQIPVALASVVGGVVGLNDFRHAAQMRPPRSLGARPQLNLNGSNYLFPADFAAIYDLNPLYGAGTTGTGVSIAVAGRSNIVLSDIAAFRAAAGLAANTPAVVLTGTDPKLVQGDQDEATLDVEWAGAVAPAARVTLVAGDSSAATDGVDLAAAYIVNHALAAVVSTSYGSCEQAMGATELAFYNSLWEQAASQGMSAFVASGDSGAAACDLGSATRGTVAAVNGLCSSPYSTCVGGTEFNEGSNSSQYWDASSGANRGSALGYIPEKVWNESAADSGGELWATGGGTSEIYPQPAWQQGVNGASAAGGMRAVPDVSLTAASHDGYMIYENGSYWIVSGTSPASPAFAALMALVVQKQSGAGQGNANPTLYRLLNGEANPFHATPAGDNSVPGVQGFQAGGADYNLATGLGSVDASLLVNGWANGDATPPTLNVSVASSAAMLVRGGTAAIVVNVVTGGSFRGNIALGLAGLATGVSARWSEEPVTSQEGSAAATLTLTASPAAQTASFPLSITAQGDGLIATGQVTVQVQPLALRPRGAPALPVARVRR